jgi:hypothetical protein
MVAIDVMGGVHRRMPTLVRRSRVAAAAADAHAAASAEQDAAVKPATTSGVALDTAGVATDTRNSSASAQDGSGNETLARRAASKAGRCRMDLIHLFGEMHMRRIGRVLTISTLLAGCAPLHTQAAHPSTDVRAALDRQAPGWRSL